ncbi:hypothetical protein ACX0G9_11550 [Flavitalea flava]
MDEIKIKILALGYHAGIMEVVLRLINSHENWSGTLVTSKEELVNMPGKEKYNVILLCTGVTLEEEQEIAADLMKSTPVPKLIRHYGGGSGLLENEIRNAFN